MAILANGLTRRIVPALPVAGFGFASDRFRPIPCITMTSIASVPPDCGFQSLASKNFAKHFNPLKNSQASVTRSAMTGSHRAKALRFPMTEVAPLLRNGVRLANPENYAVSPMIVFWLDGNESNSAALLVQ
jgi:hypothetical protein